MTGRLVVAGGRLVACTLMVKLKCSAVQCSTLCAVQCSAVQCSSVQCSAVHCSAVQCSAVQCCRPGVTDVPTVSKSLREGGATWTHSSMHTEHCRLNTLHQTLDHMFYILQSAVCSNLFIYQARESSLVPAGLLTAWYLQKLLFMKPLFLWGKQGGASLYCILVLLSWRKGKVQRILN